MSTEKHTSHHTRQSSPSIVRSRSSIPDGDKDSSVFIVNESKAVEPRITEGASIARQYPDRTKLGVPSSIEMLLIPTEEEETSNNETIHNRSLSDLSLSAPPGLPRPAPPRRFKSPQDQHAPRCDPAIADLKQQLHYSYDADLPSKSSTLSLPPPPPHPARVSSSPLQGFSLLPAIELRSVVLDEGIPPSANARRDLEAMCNWSLYDAAREQKEFIRKTEAQKQIYETAFADLEDELAELDVESNIQECQLAFFEDESEESDREKEEGGIDDSDDEGYEQDGGVDISDELEDAFPISDSESGSEKYALSFEVDAEEWQISISELVDAETCEQEEGYDADNDFEHIANSNSLPDDDPFAWGCPQLLPVQSRQAAEQLLLQASKATDDDGFEGEPCSPYTLGGKERQNREIEPPLGSFEVLDGEIATLNRSVDRSGVFINSDEAFEQQEAEIYQQLERTRPLWSIYSSILPPARNPPSWYPETLPTIGVEDPDVIPSFCFNRVKTLASGNGLSSVCVVRSVWPQRWNGVGLREDSLWAMKLYPKECGNTERKRRRTTLLHTEVDVYMRIAESPKEEKIGFAFLMNLEMTMTFPGNTALLMELMKTDLRTYMDDSQLDPRSIPRLMAQMAMGVATLHSIGIIHRDLKPENIFLDYRGNVKIGDFGTSFVTRTFMALQNDVDYDDSVAGTTEYVSPEMQSQEGMHGIEVDYWALGCVFFEMMVDDHVSLFPRSRPRELEDWIEYSKTQEGRDAFFEYEGFNEDETDLLCGLLRPDPRRRYGIDEILEHSYFLRNDGSSEFRHMKEALSRARREPVFGADERPRIRITPNPVDDTVFNWANPYGACFADRTREAATRGPGSQWT